MEFSKGLQIRITFVDQVRSAIHSLHGIFNILLRLVNIQGIRFTLDFDLRYWLLCNCSNKTGGNKSPLPQVFYPIIPLTLGEYLITKYLL
jgi:hypothetical protein